MKSLCQAAYGQLPAEVRTPAYDRRELTLGQVHLGLGAFHRAHQALYTEAALADGDLRWGVLGVSLRSRALVETLHAQDLLYTVHERHAEQVSTRLVGCLMEAAHAPSAAAHVLAALADPRVQVVTTTVTEKGYSQQPATGELDLDDADIRHDLAAPRQPRSTLGVIAEGLRLRAADAPLTLVCCDNMAANGDTVRRLLLQYAQAVDPALARRIEDTVAFPNSMVDRIVPAATAESLDWAAARLGLRDEAAIVCEPFTQWVIEDRFAAARPAWERGGALFTRDVRPFQAMKLRLLNGSHSAIAYLGQLRGRPTVASAMADPVLGGFVRRLMTEDLRASVQAPEGYDVRAYCEELLRRFENPAVAHRTEQIASDGTQKVPVRWLPALREGLARGAASPALERALAAWLHYLAQGHDEAGTPLRIADPGAPALAERLRAQPEALPMVQAALAHAPVFGHEPWPAALAERLAGHLQTLRASGTDALLA